MSWKSFISAMASVSRTPLGQEPVECEGCAQLRAELASVDDAVQVLQTRQSDTNFWRERCAQYVATIKTLGGVIKEELPAKDGLIAELEGQLRDAEATISGLGLENADLRRAIVDADNTAVRTVNP